MLLPITAFFAGLLTLYFVYLAIAVIRLRQTHQIALGAGSVDPLEAAIRAHGNFAEYVPLGLILLGSLESQHSQPVLVAILGSTLTLGRVLHAQALHHANLKRRVQGMVLTFGSLVALAILDITLAVRTWLPIPAFL
jgi:uncharacterized membrane protein YecN with MAPEG domain